ncbi:hypothetical protein QO206_03345 [Leeuwenhoekiella aequorea]|uniref:hypothetical protein n=1 Tax=Leeuwenhoekiella aequorea TaxID=283736 RepID=UPI00352DB40F|tara:strand:+ start:20912 stop:21502 length:591 start_codon:yes stop_codon:yes gene_type:complete
MQTSNQLTTLVFSLVKKAFSYQDGALVVLALPGSLGIKKVIDELTRDISIKEMTMPLVAFGVLTILYILVSIADFYTGTRAAKKEHLFSTGSNRGYMKSDKLWSSVWKFAGVILIASILTVFCLLFLLVGLGWLYEAFLFGIIAFYFVVISFDLHSIGENQLRRFNKKPDFYSFIDKVSVAIRTGLIARASKLFDK